MQSKDLISALNWRYATKQFDTTRKLSPEILDTLIESLRLTPSSFGLQLWKFIVVEDSELRAKLMESAWGQKQIGDASHLIVLCRQKSVDSAYVEKHMRSVVDTRNVTIESVQWYKNMMLAYVERANQNGKADAWMDNQVYIALGNLLTSAAVLDIDACPIEGFDSQKYDEILGLEALGLTSCVVCPVGYRSSDDGYADLAKIRLPKAEVVMTM